VSSPVPSPAPGRVHRSRSSAETEELAAGLAVRLSPGDVVLISGELGAGKTTFVRGACRALGVTVPVTSPTFTIGQRYPRRDGSTVGHVDLYRIGCLQDEDPDLLADYIGPEMITFVEWPEGAEADIVALAPVAHRVRLAHAGGDERTVEIERTGESC
jgi:tRNA threonylcarbamoyladenosine biosynthesis protein TsaE